MTLLPIVTLPDPVLRTSSEEVAVNDDAVGILARDLIETLDAHALLGMAAIMVGVRRRVAILAVGADGRRVPPLVLINPVLVRCGGEMEKGIEGCPSVPDVFEPVERPRTIVAAYRDLSGTVVTLEATGLQARVIQHQIDLCDGILFIDRLSRLKRSRIEKKLAKAARRGRTRPARPRFETPTKSPMENRKRPGARFRPKDGGNHFRGRIALPAGIGNSAHARATRFLQSRDRRWTCGRNRDTGGNKCPIFAMPRG